MPKARIRRDISKETRKILQTSEIGKWGENSLDTDRSPFTAEEIEMANKIGTPAQGPERPTQK